MWWPSKLRSRFCLKLATTLKRISYKDTLTSFVTLKKNPTGQNIQDTQLSVMEGILIWAFYYPVTLLGISIICQTLNHSYWKILKLLKYLRGCFVAFSTLWEVKGKELTGASSHLSENERASEPEAVCSEGTWTGRLVIALSLARCYEFWRAKRQNSAF